MRQLAVADEIGCGSGLVELEQAGETANEPWYCVWALFLIQVLMKRLHVIGARRHPESRFKSPEVWRRDPCI